MGSLSLNFSVPLSPRLILIFLELLLLGESRVTFFVLLSLKPGQTPLRLPLLQLIPHYSLLLLLKLLQNFLEWPLRKLTLNSLVALTRGVKPELLATALTRS